MGKFLFIVGFVLSCIFCLPTSSVASYNHWADSLQAPLRPSSDELHYRPLPEGLLPTTSDPIDSVRYYIDKAQSVMDKIRQTQNYISNLNDISVFELPVGLPKLVGGLNYDIGIYAIRLMPTHAEVDVIMQFEMPQNGKVLTFRGNRIKFTRAGGIVGDATLSLVGDYGINFSGDKVQLILHGGLDGEKTFVTMDCDGFKAMGLDAEVKFSRDVLLPQDANGNVSEGNVSATFSTTLNNWNDLIVQMTLPRFQVNGLQGFGFMVDNAVFDFSDFRNAPGVNFPEGYTTEEDPALVNLWRGFYARELSVTLPREFRNRQNAPTTLSAFDMIIDQRGVSGVFTGENLIPLNNGDMNGWAFSVDSLGVSLMANQIENAGFEGNIVIPVSDEQSPLDYMASFEGNGNYFFNVSASSDMQFKIWQTSSLEIHDASRLEVTVRDGKFLPKAVLHGRMSINAKLGDQGKGVELADIQFQDLELQSQRPFLKVGAFSFGSEAAQQRLAQFPISIQNIGLRTVSDTENALDFDLLLNLVGEESGAFAADAGLSVICSMQQTEIGSLWKPKSLEVHKIAVNIEGGAFKLNGSLQFYKNDVAYGNGFNGMVDAEFKPGIRARASAIFGNVNGMRYWYADALAEFPTPIVLFPGLGAKGFGGGAYFRMKMDNTGGSELGRTASGIVYVPDAKAGLGIKATIMICSIGSDKMFSGDLTLEAAFFQGGGLRYISFLGNGQMLSPGLNASAEKLKATSNKMVEATKKLEESVGGALLEAIKDDKAAVENIHGKAEGKEGISFRAFIEYDFENNTLHGNFDAYINVAGGVIRGIGEGGRAGWAVMHFASGGEWYVYVGTPDDRIGLKAGIGPIQAQFGSYFMVGTRILGSPPPPEKVSQILKGKDLDYMKDLNSIGEGAGLAFGSAFSISTGDLQFLIFYAKFEAGAGFDIMIKNYPETYCANTGKKIGINGWYANGQAYAYFEGAVGIRVKILGRKRSVEILSIAAAAILQAQLPNPIWLQGTVGGRFSVLNGLVKGNCVFQVTLGNQCDIVKKETNVLEETKVIADMTPADVERDVNVFNTPQVVFNMAVGRVFEIGEEDGSSIRQFRVKLDAYRVSKGTEHLSGELRWNEAGDVVAFNSYEVLPPNSQLKAFVQVSFEENVNGAWTAVIVDGARYIETKQVTFTTGEAPDYIPLTNVEYSYPVVGQLNYYPNETTEGYIRLKRGQAYLFSPGAEWRQTGRLTASDQSKAEFDIVYNNGTISFTIPKLKTAQVYAYQLMNIPAQLNRDVDRNVIENTSKVQIPNASLDTEVRSKDAEGSISDLQEKAIFNAYFRSSSFATLAAKISSLSISPSSAWQIAPGIDELNTYLEGSELFDKVETGALGTYESLVQFESLLDDSWYMTKVYPLVYDGYPIAGKLLIRLRDTNLFGVPPAKAIGFNRQTSNYLSQDAPSFSNVYDNAYITFNLPLEMSRDYIDLLSQAADLSLTTSSPRLNYILTNFFPILSRGTYRIKVKHVLPGINKVTSEKIVNLTYQY